MPDVPKVTFTRLYGFIDILNHMGGKADVSAISSREQLGLNDILPILETGQMLDFVEVKSGNVSISEEGYSILAANPRQQKIMLKQILMNLKPFQKLVDLIKQSKDGYLTKQELLEYESPSSSSDNNHNYSYDFANNFDMIVAIAAIAILFVLESIIVNQAFAYGGFAGYGSYGGVVSYGSYVGYVGYHHHHHYHGGYGPYGGGYGPCGGGYGPYGGGYGDYGY